MKKLTIQEIEQYNDSVIRYRNAVKHNAPLYERMDTEIEAEGATDGCVYCDEQGAQCSDCNYELWEEWKEKHGHLFMDEYYPRTFHTNRNTTLQGIQSKVIRMTYKYKKEHDKKHGTHFIAGMEVKEQDILNRLIDTGACNASHQEVPEQEVNEWRRGKTILFEGVEYKAGGRE